MSIVIMVLLCILWMVIIPGCIGCLPTKLMHKKYHTLGMVMLNGYVCMFGFFQMLYFPIVLLRWNDSAIFYKCAPILFLVLGCISLAFSFRNIKDYLHIRVPYKNIFFYIIIIMIGYMIYKRVTLGVNDPDDAYYMGIAMVDAVNDGGFYWHNAFTGSGVMFQYRYGYMGLVSFYSMMQRLTGIKAIIIAHIPMAIMVLMAHYYVIYEIGKILFDKLPVKIEKNKEDKETTEEVKETREKEEKKTDNKWHPDKETAVYLFTAMVAFLDLFYNVSVYTSQTFLFVRTWHGKSIFANVIVPYVLLLMIILASENQDAGLKKFPNLGYYIITGFLVFVSLMTGATGMILGPLFIGLSALVTAIGNKKPGIFAYTLLYMIPAMIMIIRIGLLLLSAKGIIFG